MNDYPAGTTTEAPEQDTLDQHQLWLDAVQTTAAKAYERMPQLADTITDAYNILVAGDFLEIRPNVFQVETRLAKGRKHWIVTDRCECPDAATAPNGYCSHVIAKMLYKRAHQLLNQHAKANGGVSTEEKAALTTSTPPAEPLTGAIHPRYIVDIQGTPAVKFAGLLLLAHERGLVSLSVEWIGNTDDLSMAYATATFSDGRVFHEGGDATPNNVNARVRGHFRRVALTRAKARALRDALGVDLVAVEELMD
jgi:hypothetical protein